MVKNSASPKRPFFFFHRKSSAYNTALARFRDNPGVTCIFIVYDNLG